jgi:ASTRA-associated protein 1
MAMRVSRTNNIALTVSADHLIGRYDLSVGRCIRPTPNFSYFASFQKASDTSPDTACVPHRTKYPGNSSIAIRDDGKVCAVGGWDGQYVLPFMT